MSRISGNRLFDNDMLQIIVIDHVFRIQTISLNAA